MIIATMGEVIGQGKLWKSRGRPGMGAFQVSHLLKRIVLALPSPRDIHARATSKNEPHSITTPFASKDFATCGRSGPKMKITVEIVFDQRNFALGQHRDKSFLSRDGHHAAERIVKIGNCKTGRAIRRDLIASRGAARSMPKRG